MKGASLLGDALQLKQTWILVFVTKGKNEPGTFGCDLGWVDTVRMDSTDYNVRQSVVLSVLMSPKNLGRFVMCVVNLLLYCCCCCICIVFNCNTGRRGQLWFQ